MHWGSEGHELKCKIFVLALVPFRPKLSRNQVGDSGFLSSSPFFNVYWNVFDGKGGGEEERGSVVNEQ